MTTHAHVYPFEVSQRGQDPIDENHVNAFFQIWTYGDPNGSIQPVSSVSVPASSSASQITRACVLAAIALLAADYDITVAEHNIITTPLAQ